MAYQIREYTWSKIGEFNKAISGFDKALSINQNDAIICKKRGLCGARKVIMNMP